MNLNPYLITCTITPSVSPRRSWNYI